MKLLNKVLSWNDGGSIYTAKIADGVYSHVVSEVDDISKVGENYKTRNDMENDSYCYVMESWLGDGKFLDNCTLFVEPRKKDIPEELKGLIKSAMHYMRDTEQSEIVKFELNKYLK